MSGANGAAFLGAVNTPQPLFFIAEPGSLSASFLLRNRIETDVFHGLSALVIPAQILCQVSVDAGPSFSHHILTC